MVSVSLHFYGVIEGEEEEQETWERSRSGQDRALGCGCSAGRRRRAATWTAKERSGATRAGEASVIGAAHRCVRRKRQRKCTDTCAGVGQRWKEAYKQRSHVDGEEAGEAAGRHGRAWPPLYRARAGGQMRRRAGSWARTLRRRWHTDPLGHDRVRPKIGNDRAHGPRPS
jgi:hypothetical protein